jgi:hypothetical protein
MRPPTFFLSSTIYDFRDLRSAIKYYLEQQGCRVLASDQNDFPKPLDKHSYEGCLKTISEADYFILLIGSRVGGWYDEPDRVSITQREYREAYGLHLQGRMKLINFVRLDVWQMREERKAVGKHIRDFKLDSVVKNQIVNHPSKLAEDPDFTIKFIEEVGKNRETAAAAKGPAPFPTGNWLHVFDGFPEVIEQLQVQAFAGLPVEEMALRRLLRQELLEILRISLVCSNGKVFSPKRGIERFHESLPKKLSLGQTRSLVNTEWLDNLCSLWISTINNRYYPTVLPRALESSTFLDFDAKHGMVKEQPVYSCLRRLADEIERFQLGKNADLMKFFAETSPKFREPVGETMEVPTKDLLGLLHVVDRWSNIVDLCKAIINHVDGKPLVMPNLRPRSPLYKDEDLDRQDATIEETEAFLRQ